MVCFNVRCKWPIPDPDSDAHSDYNIHKRQKRENFRSQRSINYVSSPLPCPHSKLKSNALGHKVFSFCFCFWLAINSFIGKWLLSSLGNKWSCLHLQYVYQWVLFCFPISIPIPITTATLINLFKILHNLKQSTLTLFVCLTNVLQLFVFLCLSTCSRFAQLFYPSLPRAISHFVWAGTTLKLSWCYVAITLRLISLWRQLTSYL